jgi:hypothetical protein
MPNILKSEIFKSGLGSVPSSLLVALVIPFTFFVSGIFLPYRIEVYSIILTIPIVLYLKKPGLSLPIAIIVYTLLNLIQNYF